MWVNTKVQSSVISFIRSVMHPVFDDVVIIPEKQTADSRVPVPGEDCRSHTKSSTDDKPPVIFSTEAQYVCCPTCLQKVKAIISSEISSSGWAFLFISCFLGPCILSCLVPCFPGFRRYTHTCPECQTVINQTEPKHSTIQLVTLVITTIAVFGLFLLALILFLTP